MAGDMVYEPQQKERALKMNLPLVKVEIDARKTKDQPMSGTRYRMWGTMSASKAERIMAILREPEVATGEQSPER